MDGCCDWLVNESLLLLFYRKEELGCSFLKERTKEFHSIISLGV
jgi:hypothetical protein